jgi:hypothetical protein
MHEPIIQSKIEALFKGGQYEIGSMRILALFQMLAQSLRFRSRGSLHTLSVQRSFSKKGV